MIVLWTIQPASQYQAFNSQLLPDSLFVSQFLLHQYNLLALGQKKHHFLQD
jgi:hypothetical protein